MGGTGEAHETRRALEFLRDAVSDLRVDQEELRRAHNEGRPAVALPSDDAGLARTRPVRDNPPDR